MVGDEPGVAGRPDGAVRGLNPETAAVLRLEDPVTGTRGLVLPRMVGRSDLYPRRPDLEVLADVVTVGRQALLVHQRCHVLRRVVLTGHARQLTAGGDAVVVVVAVRDEPGIQPRHLGGSNRKLDEHRHVEPAQQRINHHRRAATVDQEPRHAQPAQNCPVAGLERFRAEPLGLGGSRLTWHGGTLPLHRDTPRSGRASLRPSTRYGTRRSICSTISAAHRGCSRSSVTRSNTSSPRCASLAPSGSTATTACAYRCRWRHLTSIPSWLVSRLRGTWTGSSSPCRISSPPSPTAPRALSGPRCSGS